MGGGYVHSMSQLVAVQAEAAAVLQNSRHGTLSAFPFIDHGFSYCRCLPTSPIIRFGLDSMGLGVVVMTSGGVRGVLVVVS